MNAIAKTGGGMLAVVLVSFVGWSGATPAAAEVATRCGAYGCEAIRCNDGGDRCYHADGYDYDRDNRAGYRDFDDHDYDGHLVCDSDGDRCYRTREPYWNYREYYRRHGFHWSHEARYDDGYRHRPYRDYSYEDYRERRFSDRLNHDEYVRAREYNDGY